MQMHGSNIHEHKHEEFSLFSSYCTIIFTAYDVTFSVGLSLGGRFAGEEVSCMGLYFLIDFLFEKCSALGAWLSLQTVSGNATNLIAVMGEIKS